MSWVTLSWIRSHHGPSTAFAAPITNGSSTTGRQAGISATKLAAAAQLDEKLVKAIVNGNYIPSPLQRERLAAALGVAIATAPASAGRHGL